MNAFRLLVAFIGCIALLPMSYAEQGYQTPSAELAALVDAKLSPTSSLSDDGQWLALFERKRVVSLDELAKEELKLAGIKLNPANFSRSRVSAKYSAVQIKHVQSGTVININNLPQGIIRAPKWSSNSEYLAFVVEQKNDARLWLYNVKTKQANELNSIALNSVLTASPYEWLPDSSALVANLAVNLGKTRL